MITRFTLIVTLIVALIVTALPASAATNKGVYMFGNTIQANQDTGIVKGVIVLHNHWPRARRMRCTITFYQPDGHLAGFHTPLVEARSHGNARIRVNRTLRSDLDLSRPKVRFCRARPVLKSVNPD